MTKQLCHALAWQIKRNKEIAIFIAACMLLIFGFVVCNGPTFDEEISSVRFSHEIFQKIGDHLSSWKQTKKIRIACLLLTAPKYHDTRARAVMDTWGKRCDYIYFVTNKDGKEYPGLNLIYADGIPNKYGYSWGSMKIFYKFAYENLFDKVDWFIKADDDTYLIVENLKKFLEDKDTNDPVTYGRNIVNKYSTVQGYMEGGSGIVISKGALEKLLKEGFDNPKICNPGIQGNEDVRTAVCLYNLNIPMINVHDLTGELFHPRTPLQMQENITEKDWLQKSFLKPKGGLDCCSMNTITFHHVSPEWLYVLEMLVYKIRVQDVPLWIQNNPEQVNITINSKNIRTRQ